MSGTKVLDRTTEGDGTPFSPASGPFQVQVSGEIQAWRRPFVLLAGRRRNVRHC